MASNKVDVMEMEGGVGQGEAGPKTPEKSSEPQAQAAAEPATAQALQEFLQDEFDELDSLEAPGVVARAVDACLSAAKSKLLLLRPLLKPLLLLLLLLGFTVYFAFAMACERLTNEASVRLLVLVSAGVLLGVLQLARRFFGDWAAALLRRPAAAWRRLRQRHPALISGVGVVAFLAYFLGFVIGIGAQNPENLASAAGVCVIVLLALLLSAHPTKVNWRPVMGGLTLQITFAVLLLRTQPGFNAFSFVGDRVSEFILHVDSGAEFVFGKSFRDHYFAFSVLSVIVFFSSFISLMFHLGVLQVIIQKLGWVMQSTMGTTSGESLVAAANIFIGQTEAPLLIRPFVGRMTNSELHAVITSGYATIAGGVLAAYIGLGVPARHLLSASVMVAPGALALSKIMYPETKKSKTDSESIGKIEMGKYHNVIDAIGTGAINAIQLVAAIAVNLIAFISMLAFVNKTLIWFGDRACLGVDLTFEFVCGYLLWPIAFVIGVAPVDCNRVAELIGTKFFINEFVAYERFNVYRNNHLEFMKMNGSRYEFDGANIVFPKENVTLTGGILFAARSLTISTYALCGFANIGSIGMQLGVFSILLPRRKAEVVPLVLRGVVTGTMANLLTASVAGIFYQPNL